MSISVVVGAQWGDEGKGKVVDTMAKDADMVIRYQGGNNAGHTVVVAGEKYELHLIPSGILYPATMSVMAGGMAINPTALLQEMDGLANRGVSLDNLYISDSAHLVLPYHVVLDRLEEDLRGKKRLGTTIRGIGPAYADKAARRGIRMGDLLYRKRLEEKLITALQYHNLILERAFEQKPVDLDSLMSTLLEAGRRLAPHITNTSLLIDQAQKEDKKIFFEGAQGTLLDIDHGSYPFVTSSSTIAGGVTSGSGLGPLQVQEVVGVVKAYMTRVGEGPFPTEDKGEAGNILREKGGEYGVTTGRPRRCGWLDLPLLRHAHRVNGFSWLVLTKLDVLSDFDEIKVAVAYETDGETIDEVPTDSFRLANCKPVYEVLPGWKGQLKEVRSFEDLPDRARDFVLFLEEKLKLPLQLLGVGPDRDQTIFREERRA